MSKDCKDSSTLIFKNIPKQIEDLTSLLDSLKIPAKEIKPFGRKRALITYQLKSEAECALNTLKELEFGGKTANVSLFCKNKPKEERGDTSTVKKCHRSVQTATSATAVEAKQEYLTRQQVSKYVQKLYAIEGDLGFDQPPPPYLKYSYPPINKDIMDNICIALLSNKRFYTQVVHLMNRMNLEPPFHERKYKFTAPGEPREMATQTEHVKIQETLTDTKEHSSKEQSESEMESSEEDVSQRARPQLLIKRKLPKQEEQYKKKARLMLQNAQKQNKETCKKSSNQTLSLKDIFETPEQDTTATATKIELQLKRPAKVEEVMEKNQKSLINLPEDLKSQKLTMFELEQLTIYKNYQKGLASNKLYIKNLHKDVSSEDLQLIYERYVKANDWKLDIKVMQHGRMKGQAFVTFQADNKPETMQPLIAQALEDTNGFVLRDKPMVVCYGKHT